MSPRYLLGTNVLVCAVDPREPANRDRAREAIRRPLGHGGHQVQITLIVQISVLRYDARPWSVR